MSNTHFCMWVDWKIPAAEDKLTAKATESTFVTLSEKKNIFRSSVLFLIGPEDAVRFDDP